MSDSMNQDAIDRLLSAIEDLQRDVREVRQEGRERNEIASLVHGELRMAVSRIAETVQRHGSELSGHRLKIVDMVEQLEAHHRLIMALTEQSASNNSVLAKHAELITTMGEAIAGAKDRARGAQKSAEDLRQFTEEFQRAVTKHVTDATTAFQGGVGELKASGERRDLQLQDLTLSTHAIVAALELETQVEQAKKGLPPDKKDRTALDALRSKNQGTMVASMVAVVLLVLRIVWEVLQQSHVLPPAPATVSPQVQVDPKLGKP